MSDFYLKMISSNGVFYEGLCNSLIIPAPDGERAVMAHHEELMIAVTEGEARFRKKEGEAFTSVVVGRGYCQVANNRVVLLTDTIESEHPGVSYDAGGHGKSTCKDQGIGKICRILKLRIIKKMQAVWPAFCCSVFIFRGWGSRFQRG